MMRILQLQSDHSVSAALGSGQLVPTISSTLEIMRCVWSFLKTRMLCMIWKFQWSKISIQVTIWDALEVNGICAAETSAAW